MNMRDDLSTKSQLFRKISKLSTFHKRSGGIEIINQIIPPTFIARHIQIVGVKTEGEPQWG